MSAAECVASGPMPGPGAVRVWIANVDSVPAEVAWDGLDPTERERALRFLRPKDAHRFAAARRLLRSALEACLGVVGEALHFEPDPCGKPRLTPPWREHPVHFCVSHAGEVMAVAIAGHRVGVDVERVRRLPDLDAVARVCFTTGELRLLDVTNPAERHELFFAMWTRKEAWAKALGVGLGAPLPSTTPDFPAGWSGAPLVCAPGYRSAVVIEGERIGVEYASACAAAPVDPVSR